MAECNEGGCAVHEMVMLQISTLHKRTEELYALLDKERETTDMKIEKALSKQKEYLQEVVRSASANTKLWIIGQGFANVLAVIGIYKIFLEAGAV